VTRLATPALRTVLHRYPLARGRSRLTRLLEPLQPGERMPMVPGPGRTVLQLDLAQQPSRQWYWFGAWEPADMAALPRLLRPGMVAVDAGANIGIFTLAMARLVGESGEVHAFEPEPGNAALLEENVRRNDLEGTVTVVRSALGEEAGSVSISTGPDAASAYVSDGGVEVPRLRLDDYPLSRLDLLKLDIEGAELGALRGAARTIERFRPVLLVECAERHLARAGGSARELIGLLRAAGYDCFAGARPVREDSAPANENVICLPRAQSHPLVEV
jgi:FkbM family methyltransferase